MNILPGDSRFVPVTPGGIKHFKTTGAVSRFKPDHPGLSRFVPDIHGAATVVLPVAHGSPRFTKPGRTGASNRDSENAVSDIYTLNKTNHLLNTIQSRYSFH